MKVENFGCLLRPPTATHYLSLPFILSASQMGWTGRMGRRVVWATLAGLGLLSLQLSALSLSEAQSGGGVGNKTLLNLLLMAENGSTSLPALEISSKTERVDMPSFYPVNVSVKMVPAALFR